MSIMKFFREKIKIVFVFVIISLIISLFAGIGSYIFIEKRNVILNVNDKKLKLEIFQNIKNNLIYQLRNEKPDEDIDEKKINMEIINSFIQEAIFLEQANKIGEIVSDKEVMAFLLSYPAFQRNNQFDMNAYYQTLRFVLKQTPKNFEKTLMEKMKINKMKLNILNFTKITKNELDFEYEMFEFSNRNDKNISKENFKNNFLIDKKKVALSDWYSMNFNKAVIKTNFSEITQDL